MITPPLGQSSNESYSVVRDIVEYFGSSSILEESSFSIGRSSDSVGVGSLSIQKGFELLIDTFENGNYTEKNIKKYVFLVWYLNFIQNFS